MKRIVVSSAAAYSCAGGAVVDHLPTSSSDLVRVRKFILVIVFHVSMCVSICFLVIKLFQHHMSRF